MQDLKDWLAYFYAQTEVKDLLDHDLLSTPPDTMCDIWDGQAFREFQGPDGKLFLDCPPGES